MFTCVDIDSGDACKKIDLIYNRGQDAAILNSTRGTTPALSILPRPVACWGKISLQCGKYRGQTRIASVRMGHVYRNLLPVCPTVHPCVHSPTHLNTLRPARVPLRHRKKKTCTIPASTRLDVQASTTYAQNPASFSASGLQASSRCAYLLVSASRPGLPCAALCCHTLQGSHCVNHQHPEISCRH